MYSQYKAAISAVLNGLAGADFTDSKSAARVGKAVGCCLAFAKKNMDKAPPEAEFVYWKNIEIACIKVLENLAKELQGMIVEDSIEGNLFGLLGLLDLSLTIVATETFAEELAPTPILSPEQQIAMQNSQELPSLLSLVIN